MLPPLLTPLCRAAACLNHFRNGEIFLFLTPSRFHGCKTFFRVSCFDGPIPILKAFSHGIPVLPYFLVLS